MCTELGFFALYLVHQNRFFLAIKSTFQQFFQFVTLRGDSFDFGQSKITPSKKNGQKEEEEEKKFNWNKWNRKMGGKSFNITCGAFGDTLL